MSACSESLAVIKRPALEVSDIFGRFGNKYQSIHSLPLSHIKIMHAIQVCRTRELGGHIERCEACGFEIPAYNSCRNRHCPKCQALTKAKWLEARKKELFSTVYFHNVFTLPHEINPLALANKKIIYTMLFAAVSETLLEFGADQKYGLGGKIGFIAILHTWDQKLLDHIHLHCVIPGGVLSFDKKRWIPSRDDFLFDVRELSKAFRGKFIHLLEKAYKKEELIFPGQIANLGDNEGFSDLTEKLWSKDWVVYSKESFVDPEYVLDYLGRYTHRVAISNNRLISIDEDTVTFSYKDRKDKGKIKPITLSGDEFIRRFFLHALPDDFMRIRYFGFLANRYKAENLTICRDLLKMLAQPPQEDKTTTTEELMLELCGLDITLCPLCGQGKMRVVEIILPASVLNRIKYRPKPQFQDTS